MNLAVNIKGERVRGLKRERGEGASKLFNYPPEMGGVYKGVVSFAAVIRVVTQRCVTTLTTAAKETNKRGEAY